MLVSHFELIFKPQAPANPGGSTAVDKVIQGYFLEITNLADKDYSYGLEFVQSPPTSAKPFRSLADNTSVFIDTPPDGDNAPTVLAGTLTSSVFRPATGPIRVKAGGTALVAVLPSVFPGGPDPTPLPNPPSFETRGHVRITLPALFKGPFFFRTEAQAAEPVPVLLTPQHRATFIKADGSIGGQIQASLPLAKGKAKIDLPPEPGGPIVLGPIAEALSPNVRELMRDSGATAGDMLASMLGGVSPDDQRLMDFNAALSKAGSKIGLARL